LLFKQKIAVNVAFQNKYISIVIHISIQTEVIALAMYIINQTEDIAIAIDIDILKEGKSIAKT
jgi:hypothetical protein